MELYPRKTYYPRTFDDSVVYIQALFDIFTPRLSNENECTVVLIGTPHSFVNLYDICNLKSKFAM